MYTCINVGGRRQLARRGFVAPIQFPGSEEPSAQSSECISQTQEP